MSDLVRGALIAIPKHQYESSEALGMSRVLFLDDGRIVEEAPPADFFHHPQTERAQRFLRTFTFDAVAKQ